MTKIIGLTGGIGSGKSTVAKYLESKGIPIYIADIEAKNISNSEEVKNEILNVFGKKILTNNEIDRKKLASIVFNDKSKLEQLNQIIHPKVKNHFQNWIKKNKNFAWICKESALLFETNAYKDCDFVVLVTAPLELRVQRTMLRDNLTKQEVEKRIENQMDDKDKIQLSDFIIQNIDLQDTYKQVDKLLKKLK